MFKPGVYKCSCCGHLIFAHAEFEAQRGLAYKALSLTDGGDEDYLPGKFCEILARNYTLQDDLEVKFYVQTKPVPAKIVEEGTLHV